jgi:phage terminase large subunit-like protein
VVAETNSKAEAVPGKPKDGANVSFAVTDETHQMRDLSLYESFETGTGAREQPLLVSVSSAGFGTENPCKQLQDQAEKVLNRTVEDEELFAAIWTIDIGVDWKSDLALLMANPNAGVSVTMDYLRSQQKVAINNPAKYASFATKHLNITVGASQGFYSLEKWRLCKSPISIHDFTGKPAWIAIDLANKLDLTAVSTVFRDEIDGHEHYYVFSDAFAPEEAVSNNPVYTQWAARGLLHVTEGNIVDKNDIIALITRASRRIRYPGVYFRSLEFIVHRARYKKPASTYRASGSPPKSEVPPRSDEAPARVDVQPARSP